MRVLIADDDRDTVMTLGILLRSEGHEVWSTQSGGEVAEAVRGFKPGVVLLDLKMRDRSGFDVARELCREHGPECPSLVAVTGQASPEAREMAKGSGIHHFLTKPCNPFDLLRLVHQIEQQAAARTRSAEPPSMPAAL